MKGNVVGFDPDTNTGAISGHDGKRYDFATSDWHRSSRPQHGDLVDFVPEGQHAAQIYLIEAEYVAPGFGQFYFSPSGRISRSQYWLKYFVPVLVISIILSLIDMVGGPGALSGLFQLAVAWPSVAVIDFSFDRSAAAAVLGVISGVLWVAVLVVAIWFFVEFGCMRGTIGANRYGPDPVPAP